MYIYTIIWVFCHCRRPEFSAYALHATPATLMVYVPILLVNTLGNVADKVRLLTALWCVSPGKIGFRAEDCRPMEITWIHRFMWMNMFHGIHNWYSECGRQPIWFLGLDLKNQGWTRLWQPSKSGLAVHNFQRNPNELDEGCLRIFFWRGYVWIDWIQVDICVAVSC